MYPQNLLLQTLMEFSLPVLLLPRLLNHQSYIPGVNNGDGGVPRAGVAPRQVEALHHVGRLPAGRVRPHTGEGCRA